ncbi:MAG: hypothetical protein OXG05_11660 [Gammaproteobacteria bacterium]|nr:hypothetical protein [Gammaproteobacteria bacterium]
MRISSSLIGVITVLGLLCAVTYRGAEDSVSERKMDDSSMMFSFGEPASFEAGTDEEKQILKDIAESEFSLDHLPAYERDLAYEALSKSGIEVQDACSVDMNVAGSLGAFFVRHKRQEETRFHPDQGVFEVPSDTKEEAESGSWEKIAGDYTEYPYPFGDARLIPKVIPVNLSSVQVTDSDETRVTYDAKPSALLFMKMRPEERILDDDQLRVRFEVDRATRRVTNLTLYLPKGAKVYRGIRITNLEFEFEFEEDELLDRNVLKRVNHAMKGRIWGLFRPNFSFTTDLSYADCNGARNEHSYLVASIDSIRALN